MSGISAITCRRCGQPFALGPRTLLPACPRCGRAPVPLRMRMANNRLAAILATLALVTLAVGMTMPFITMEKLGSRTSYSLVGGVRQLFEQGYVIIGSVLLVFSVIFPVAKLLALLAATSRLTRLSNRWRRGLHKAADLTGKYSMLDLVVVAVIIVLVRFDNLAHVEAHAGTAWFCGAILLSMAASLCVNVPAEGEVS